MAVILNRFVSLILSISMLFTSFFSLIGSPVKGLKILVPKNWEMSVGDSRTLDFVFKNKDKTGAIEWEASPASVAEVDEWGRVTATGVGKATITAASGKLKDKVTLKVVATPTLIKGVRQTHDYKGNAVTQVKNRQKVVTRYPKGSPEVPEQVSNITDYTNFQQAVTADGAMWTVTDYGVLRYDANAPTKRDVEQRFMGDRYFYEADTTEGKVLAIIPDGEYGIWTVMHSGFSHISMAEMSGTQKAELMSDVTRTYVDRRGMVSQARYSNNAWRTYDDDNDGLWTSMYGAGELMRYAALKNDPEATPEQIEQARQSATRASEAVLLLHYIPMRTGTTQAYIRRHVNGNFPGDTEDRWLSADALEQGGNEAVYYPSQSPAVLFNSGFINYALTGSDKRLMNDGFYTPLVPDNWSNPADDENAGKEYAKRTRLLKGFVARTYSLKSENNSIHGNIYWRVNNDNTATGVSSVPESSPSYLINYENLRGVVVDASAEVPQRLWDSLLGSDYTAEDIIYKGDTSADELIGHVFIFKLIYDILVPEDPELGAILAVAANNLAQHLVDNSHQLVDGSGQPTTWSDFSRQTFCSGSAIAMSPLHSLVSLSIFKVAAYITGYQKWEDEYRFLALDPAYEFAELASQYGERIQAAVAYTLDKEASPLLATAANLLANTRIMETLKRLALNYSDEEMAMLAFYVLFQLESDSKLLCYYRLALEDWWASIRYSENPLWYYIYQLAYPGKTVKDAYGNNILKTAAWSLSRHPIDTVQFLASNKKRDDIASLDLTPLGLNIRSTLSYSVDEVTELPDLSGELETADILKLLVSISKLKWAVAAPDERALHKYNTCSYWLDSHHNTRRMEASTTYTLPYWLGVYHGMLK